MSKSKNQLCAGTVTLQRQESGVRVLLVHRPAYDDWTLPKGHVEPDEYLQACAVRETREESGVDTALHQPIGTIHYPVGGGMKTVFYWLASPVTIHKHKPDAEVDKVTWLSPRHALARMTYNDEKEVLLAALDAPQTTPLLIVRHGKAMARAHWSGRDQARPVSSRGRKQAKALIPLLGAYGVRQLESSSSTRCVQTLKPYAKHIGSDPTCWATLSEEMAEATPPAVAKLMTRMGRDTAKGTRIAVCGHRPVLPSMISAFGVQPRPMMVGAVLTLHLDADGQCLAHEWIKPLR